MAAPYFNKREDLVLFARYLEKCSPSFPDKKIRKEKVFSILFPNNKYEEKTIAYLMNYLLKQAEIFLGYEKIREDKFLVENAILEALMERQLEKNYSLRGQKIATQMQQIGQRKVQDLYNEYRFAHIRNQSFIMKKSRRSDSSLQQASEKLDQFYFLQKLKFICEMISREIWSADTFDMATSKEIVRLFQQDSRHLDQPLIRIYSLIYRTLSKENEVEGFEQIKSTLDQYGNQLSLEEKRTIYQHLINYSISQISKNINIEYFMDECMTFYLKGIEEETLLVNGYLSPWTFMNVIRLGFNLDKYDWTEQFIQNNYPKLEEIFREDALHYNLADLHYRRKNYDEAQLHLHQVQHSDIFYTIGAKILLIKIYYEQGITEALPSLLASFSIYLKRNKKISNNYRENYLNFSSILQSILKAKKDKLPTIKDKITTTNLLVNRSWLLEICEEKMV